jgi:hypothetical protein
MPNHQSQKSVISEQKTLNGWSEEKINQKLLDLGLTNDQISDLIPEAKIEIAKEKKARRVLSFSRSGYNFNGKTDTTNDIDLTTVAIDLGSRHGSPYIKVVSTYHWNRMPFFRYRDGFSISWSEGWYGSSWGFTDQQKKPSYCGEPNGCTYKWTFTSHYDASEEDRLAGVGWEYDLTRAAVDAKGTAYVYLEGNNASIIKKTKYSTFNTWYGHDKGYSNLSINIGIRKKTGVAASVSFGGESYTTDRISIYNPNLSY